MLQEEASGIAWRSIKMVAGIIVVTYKLLVLFVIPGIQHGIKHGWIFIPLGIIVAGIIHITLYDVLYSPMVSHIIAALFYMLGVAGGVKLMLWKRRRGKLSGITNGVYINPDMPADLYEEPTRHHDEMATSVEVGTLFNISDESGESTLYVTLASMSIGSKQYVAITSHDALNENVDSDIFIVQFVTDADGKTALETIKDEEERAYVFERLEELLP